MSAAPHDTDVFGSETAAQGSQQGHGGDTDYPGATPDEVQPGEGGDTDNPDPGIPETAPDQGDTDNPAAPDELPSIDPVPQTPIAPD